MDSDAPGRTEHWQGMCRAVPLQTHRLRSHRNANHIARFHVRSQKRTARKIVVLRSSLEIHRLETALEWLQCYAFHRDVAASAVELEHPGDRKEQAHE